MKKTIIRLTESDLHQMIMETAQKLLKEYDRDEWDEYPDDYYEPSFNTVTVYYHFGQMKDERFCSMEMGDEIGIWIECECSVSGYDIENDGIGSYEFWGHPGYDEGTDYAVPNDVDVEIVNWEFQRDETTEELTGSLNADIDWDGVKQNYAKWIKENETFIKQDVAEYCLDNNLFEEQ